MRRAAEAVISSRKDKEEPRDIAVSTDAPVQAWCYPERQRGTEWHNLETMPQGVLLWTRNG